jgi:hypothetical protein
LFEPFAITLSSFPQRVNGQADRRWREREITEPSAVTESAGHFIAWIDSAQHSVYDSGNPSHRKQVGFPAWLSGEQHKQEK